MVHDSHDAALRVSGGCTGAQCLMVTRTRRPETCELDVSITTRRGQGKPMAWSRVEYLYSLAISILKLKRDSEFLYLRSQSWKRKGAQSKLYTVYSLSTSRERVIQPVIQLLVSYSLHRNGFFPSHMVAHTPHAAEQLPDNGRRGISDNPNKPLSYYRRTRCR